MFRFAPLMLIPALVACGEQAPSHDAAAPPKVVRVAAVEERALARSYSLTATTRAVERATLAPQVSGVLSQRPVKLGDRVERGALLARLENPELAPALEAARARLDELRLQHAQAERDWQRMGELFAKGVVTQRETEQAKTRRDALGAAVNSAEAEVARARRLVAETVMHAPIAGEVERIDVEPGEFVPAGQSVITIAGEAVEAAFGVPETLLPQMRLGQSVILTLPLFEGRIVHGRIVELADTAALPVRLFPVIVALEEGDGIRPGLTVSWTLQSHDRPRLTIPLQALASPAGIPPRVYRLVGERVEAVSVQPLGINGERVAVEGELRAGDELVVAGINNLVDGIRVEVQR